MAINITEVKNKKDLKKFISFQRRLYKSNPYYVPPLDRMEKKSFSTTNPMTEGCEFKLWLAQAENKIVGRIACIINHEFNKDKNIKQARFYHFDCINDKNIAHQLFAKAEEWAKKKQMEEIVGPFGFNNLDKHGMLIEGFQELACQSSNYNFPYYQELVESYSFTKQHDWIEQTITIPEEEPPRILKFSEILKKRYSLSVLDLKNKETLQIYAPKLLDLYNETYAQLYGVSPLNEKQKQHLFKSFINLTDKDLISVVIDKEKNIIGFGITMMSFSRSLQKANGRLFPFGFIHLLRNKKNNHKLDLLLIGIHPDYQHKGINALIFHEINKGIRKNNITTMETTQNLESNQSIQKLWEEYKTKLNKRARLYRKNIL